MLEEKTVFISDSAIENKVTVSKQLPISISEAIFKKQLITTLLKTFYSHCNESRK